MTTKRMKSNRVRTYWRDALDHVRAGNEIVVEHYTKPVARIVPIEENTMTAPERFTAWLTTDPTALDQACADVVVLRDELRGEADDPNAWAASGDERFKAVTTVDARDGDHEDAMREAAELLAAAGWRMEGAWEATDTGYIVTVTRT